MKLVRCTRCGSRELVEEDGFAVCTYCRSRFAPQADDLPKRETVIGVHSDIQLLLNKCKADPANSRRYANLILDLDPNNYEATTYLR